MDIKSTNARFAFFTPEKDAEYLREAIRVGTEARAGGNNPFGAVLVDAKGGILMRQGNIERTEHDCTGHAETTLARRASMAYDRDFLWNCTLYTSFEPCAMCTGAIYWGNIGRIVYAASEKSLLQETGDNEINPTFDIDCRTILTHGQKAIVVCGPYDNLEADAVASHAGFWD